MSEQISGHAVSGAPADERLEEAVRMGGWFLIGGGVSSAVVAAANLVYPLPDWRPLVILLFGLGSVGAGLALQRLRARVGWSTLYAISLVTVPYVGVAMVLGTGAGSFGPIFVLWAVLWAFTFHPLRWAVAVAGASSITLAVYFAIEPGWPVPFIYWFFLSATIGITGWTVRTLVARAERANAELAVLNRTLEAQVADQVDQLQRLGGLRRFLSTPVADAVVSGDGESLLEPHRGEIAVFFCDLRGFTAFAASSEPEDVHLVLQEYFGVLGEIVREAEATVGAFTGDGLMAFFNDPLPCLDPAGRAVAMAARCQSAMRAPLELWRDRGHVLGFGVGISFGYANIGMIGFDGRVDYTALGPVVNLASRLCAEAASGETLIDQRTYVACRHTVEVASPRLLELKGFRDPVTAYPVIELNDPPVGAHQTTPEPAT